ncbi:hypothetical protein LX32DRAFT_231159 [Colletotrichum zoysiae]|uniref:Uncharacterized protein n=1 Tax=Colletotrichum zoysiae TaxID=1216348 RepID=A0AAD9LUQ2_9PEZI|nr:hypothetical protein LX32DRAFT_231159 [Colletotrichum zoysiae]
MSPAKRTSGLRCMQRQGACTLAPARCPLLFPGPPSAPLVFLLTSRSVPAPICLSLPTVIPNLGNRCNRTGEPSVNTGSDHISHKRRHRWYRTIHTRNTKTDRR